MKMVHSCYFVTAIATITFYISRRCITTLLVLVVIAYICLYLFAATPSEVTT